MCVVVQDFGDKSAEEHTLGQPGSLMRVNLCVG